MLLEHAHAGGAAAWITADDNVLCLRLYPGVTRDELHRTVDLVLSAPPAAAATEPETATVTYVPISHPYVSADFTTERPDREGVWECKLHRENRASKYAVRRVQGALRVQGGGIDYSVDSVVFDGCYWRYISPLPEGSEGVT